MVFNISIKPSDVYRSKLIKSHIKDLLTKYIIKEFRPPVVGDTVITEDGVITYCTFNYNSLAPRFIVEFKQPSSEFENIWE